MKKLLLLMTMVVLSFGMTSCNPKNEIAMKAEFIITANVPADADITKIENLLQSKGLPIGVITITVDKTGDDATAREAIEAKVKQIVADFLKKVKPSEINALNTGATTVYYTGQYPGSSSAISVAKLDVK